MGADPLREALVARLLELCAIESPTGSEAALCDHVESTLRHSGCQVLRHGNSLVGLPGPRAPKQRPTIGLVGHLDTVPPRQDVPVHSDGERVFGAGASDMKAGLAVMLELNERLPFADMGVDVTFVFYEREEGPYLHNGLGPLLEAHEAARAIDLAFLLEPSDNRLQPGSLGTIHCTLTFQGKRAHSARPWQGENAIEKAGPLLAELHAQQPRSVFVGGLEFREVMSVTMVDFDGARNVVPERFSMNLNYRFAPGRSLDAAKADIEALVRGRCQIDYTDLCPSGPVCTDNTLLAPLLADADLVVEPKQAWTDVARLGLAGIDAVNLGPGQADQAHQRNERCRIDLIVEGYRLFESYLCAF